MTQPPSDPSFLQSTPAAAPSVVDAAVADAGSRAREAQAAVQHAAHDAGEAVRKSARHIAGRLGAIPGALPRLAAAGAARARDVAHRAGPARHAAASEREAQRREQALAAAESGPGTDWAHVGIFGAGVVVGALIGAGAALLLAPATGFETRARLAGSARRSGARAADRVGDLTEGARRGAKRGARRLGRAATSARWAAEDAWERRRGRD